MLAKSVQQRTERPNTCFLAVSETFGWDANAVPLVKVMMGGERDPDGGFGCVKISEPQQILHPPQRGNMRISCVL